MTTNRSGGIRRGIAAAAVSLFFLVPLASHAQNTCNPDVSINLTGANFADIGSVYTVDLTFGVGDIGNGTTATINDVRYNLDCTADDQSDILCDSATAKVSYQNNFSVNAGCPEQNWTVSHSAGDTDPNRVTFTPQTPFVINENTTPCTITFDVQVEEFDEAGDTTPNELESNGGYDGVEDDIVCDNGLSPAAVAPASIVTCPVCDDELFCNGEETCDQTTGQCVPGTPVVCTDGLFCNGNEECVEETDSCSNPPDVVCSDGLFCNGVEECDEDTDSCTNPPDVVCDDEATCTTDVCDEGIDDCVFTPDDTVCDDQDVCTDNICDPEDPSADTVTGCTFPEDTTDPDESCFGDVVCRTCGFWGNHPDLTQQLLDVGNIEVCGGPQQTTTDSNDPASANEAICVKVQGKQYRQLARQLTCMALNCEFSGAGEDCEGANTGGQDLGALFAECDPICATAAGGGTNAGVGACIDRINCINNGGTPVETDPGEWACAGGECSIDGELCGFDEGDCALNQCVEGSCTLGGDPCTVTADCTDTQSCDLFEDPNCHQLGLCPEEGEFCFDPIGPARPGECRASNKTTCTYPDLDCPDPD